MWSQVALFLQVSSQKGLQMCSRPCTCLLRFSPQGQMDTINTGLKRKTLTKRECVYVLHYMHACVHVCAEEGENKVTKGKNGFQKVIIVLCSTL